MTHIPNQVGMVRIEDASRILRTIFLNHPELKPYNPAPVLVRDCTVHPDRDRFEGVVAWPASTVGI
jgi:hypothetical protein